MRGANPHVPYSPEEIAREAEKGWRAGASILHWHARDPETGVPRHDVDDYAEVVKRVRDTTDLITQPTLGYTSAAAVEDRIAHIVALADDPRLRIEMAPVDFGPVSVDFWDAGEQRFVPGDAIYPNSRASIEATLRGLQAARAPVTTVAWNVSQARTVLRFREAGLVPARTFWEFPFTGDAFPAGPGAEIHELLALVAAIPRGEPWLVMCFNGDVMALAAWAITLGGHVAIGTGDHDYARLGAPDNGELVARVAQLAETLGRPVATPAQAREIIGLPAL